MVIAYDNARRRHGAMTFLLRVETISEICEELKLLWAQGKTSLIRHRALEAPLSPCGRRLRVRNDDVRVLHAQGAVRRQMI
jgi:hypothetical protein